MAEYIKKSDVLAYPIWHQSYDKANGNAHFISGVESVMEFVEGLPTADVAEVRHARWIPDITGQLFCSECKQYGVPNRVTKYCPNCGALMKEAEHEAG